ncbi:MAG TPA: CheR family methyltransferase, partial [Candidatus Nanopelagicales bacterium]|nr:CheR family methyltransferase [Candidatus Nanopelagicales bacterium]
MPDDAEPPPSELPPEIAEVVEAVRRATDRDLHGYRGSTLSAAIHRRVGRLQATSAAAYAVRLRDDPAEANLLLGALRPRVPRLFRELPALHAAAQGLREDRRRRGGFEATRAWIPGCGTGEEAYSLAALLLDPGPFAGHGDTLQVLATDLGAHALDAARAGLYPADAFTDVPPERLVPLFVPEGEGYRVSRALRAAVTFLEHDVLSDPPFTGLDLLSCRTLLLYLTPDARRRALSIFHHALREGGLLLLGAADTLDPRELLLFEPVASRWRLFRRRRAAHTPPPGQDEGQAAPDESQLANQELADMTE